MLKSFYNTKGTQIEMQDFTACYVITKLLPQFGNNFVQPTISLQKVHVGWAQDYAQ